MGSRVHRGREKIDVDCLWLQAKANNHLTDHMITVQRLTCRSEPDPKRGVAKSYIKCFKTLVVYLVGYVFKHISDVMKS